MKYKKFLSICLNTFLLFNIVTSSYVQAASEPDYTKGVGVERAHQLNLTNRIQGTLEDLNVKATSEEPVEILVISQLESDISKKLYSAGATEVINIALGAYKIKIAPKDAYKLAYISEMVSLGKNHIINLEETEKAPIVIPNLEYSNKVNTIKELWAKGYDGKNTVIGIIDTGVEPDHELLKMTLDGKLKITDYQDFTSGGFSFDNPQPTEGDIKLVEIQANSTNIMIPYQYLEKNVNTGMDEVKSGTISVTIPDSIVGKKVLGGVFTEHKMLTMENPNDPNQAFDTNKNGEKDRFAVLCFDEDNDGIYDRMLFDTNNDRRLETEKEIGVYKHVASELKDKVIFKMKDNKPELDADNNPIVLDEYREKYNLLTNSIKNTKTEGLESETKFNFVCTRIDRETFGTWYANISYDSRGHGTHVAGDAAASGYVAHDFVDKDVEATQRLLGAAPNAQIMALRVFKSAGGTSEDMYIKAMCYAAVNGVDVVNMSLGSQPDFTNGMAMGSMYADLLTIKYGTIFTISNGNNGFGINSNGSPGDSWLAITVGAYCPSFYTYDYTAANTPNQMWTFSSVGPADDGRIKPDVIAPGSMISAVPMWTIIGSGYDENGTFKDYANKPTIGYAREQGTSMAAPYTAGVVAALLQSVKAEEIPYHPLLLKEALTKTANSSISVGKYNPVEIGSGMVDPLAAYEELKNIKASDKLPKLVTGNTPLTKWPYDFSDQSLKFTSYLDLYLTNNVLYKNDDRMKMSNAAGVYVRDKDIPNFVDVEISNSTGKDINAQITKTTYGLDQETNWLEVQNNLSLEKGKKEVIRLSIDKTKLSKGVNVILVKIDDSNTYQLDGVIPVTIINSEKIDINTPVVVQNSEVMPGSYSRQFIKVDKNIDKFKVTLEVPQLDDSLEKIRRVRPVIYFPNGIKYHWPEETKFAGYQRPEENFDFKPGFKNKIEVLIDRDVLEKAAMDYKTYNPNPLYKWDGVWEIDVISSVVSEGNVNSTLKVSIADVMLSENSKYLELGAGEMYNGALTVANASGKDIFVKSHGLIDMNKNKKKEKVLALREFNTIERLFEIKAGEKNVLHRVIVTNASYGEGARVWLYLYKAQVNPNGSYELIKPMINKYINVQVNGMESEMITYNLEPGYYAYVAFAGALEYGPVDFDLISQIVNESDAEKDTMKLESSALIADGSSQSINYSLKAPVETGKYLSRITFQDIDGKTIKYLPIYAEVEGTKKLLQVKQDSIALNKGEFNLNVEAEFPSESLNKDKLYGVEFELKYNPEELSAKDVLKGDVFTDTNSYKVKVEILKDDKGIEIGRIKFAYAFKGRDIYGVSSGNVAKIKFTTNKMGISPISVDGLSVGNYLGNELAVKILKENIITANPDVNNDGVVDIKDYAYCAYSFGADKNDIRYRINADVNRDGKIDEIDVNYIIENFNYKF